MVRDAEAHPTSGEGRLSAETKSCHNAAVLDPNGEKLGAILKDKQSAGFDSMLKSVDLFDKDAAHLEKAAPCDAQAELVRSPITDRLQDFISKYDKPWLPEIQFPDIEEEFICGWGAAFINITSTFPINKAIFRQQLQGVSVYVALKQLKHEGLRYLYRGLLPPLLQKTTSLSIMFGSYHKFQLELDKTFPAVPRPVNHAAAGMMAGTLEMTLSPFERIQTLLQDERYQKRFNNSFHTARELWAFGIREYYRGGTIIFMRNGPSNVFFFLGREFLNEQIPKLENASSRFVKDFLCGACLGALISTGFFPLNVVKTRMQSRLGGPFHGVVFTFHEVWAERKSMSNLFRGFHLNYTRSFLSWGIINATYELLMRFFRGQKEDRRL
ncbi:mitochondrial nicotinamide adenine dinucleotide transporter SLC25A51-like [Littorina saxatilis]|uniref:mitochondrial nicotinamide adenine dinucleotide transporter SLC25A51-like n=1 Tax=Littorina saxatilis TaxID=31220 RepID=UPI0038B51593